MQNESQTGIVKASSDILSKFNSDKPIMMGFPFEFETTGYKAQEFKGCCSKCDGLIQDDMLRGSLSMPLKSVAVVNALGFCPSCNLITPFLTRIRDDLSIEWIDSKSKKWVTARPEQKYGFLVRIFRKIKRLIQT